MSAVEELRKAICIELGVKDSELPPSPFTLRMEAVLRTPYLLIVLFEERAVQESAFVTEDDTPGSFTRRYDVAIRKLYSGKDQAPYTLSAAQEGRVTELTEIFSSMGTQCNPAAKHGMMKS